MRKVLTACSALGFAAIIAAGCSHETKTVRREEIRTVPAPAAAVLERRVVETTVPGAPVVVEKRTTVVESVPPPAVIERKTTVIEEED